MCQYQGVDANENTSQNQGNIAFPVYTQADEAPESQNNGSGG